MKTQVTITRKGNLKSIGFLMILLLTFMVWNPVVAQTSKIAASETAQEGKTIKGVITNENGPLESASIVLKGTSVGTTTDAKGEFTFPKLLKTGDVLLITYIGYETQEAKIKENTSVLRLQLSEELVEFTGALNNDKPYKSKRSKE